MKRFALAAVLLATAVMNTGCQHCCWTIFPDVPACGPGLGCGERYWGDWKACPDPCDKCANWIGHGNASYNKWGRREDGGGCEKGCASCGCGGAIQASYPSGGDCGCGGGHETVVYEE